MGLLVDGTPLDWEDSLEYLNIIRRNGIQQFLSTYKRVCHLNKDKLLWGDELEYGIFKIDPKTKTIDLSLRSVEILNELNDKEKINGQEELGHPGCRWLPEYGNWMVEATPKIPYSGFTCDLLKVEKNMRLRRLRLLKVLKNNEIAPTVTCFPLLGVNTIKDINNNNKISLSNYLSDNVIHPHPRFRTLTANIRKRKESKININIPIYNNNSNNNTNKKKESNQDNNDKESIHMDCMAFGMGMCCLQVTFQAQNIDESRHLYDHLAVLAPLFLALTAATPILKGKLANTDVRWSTIAQSVDDRTPFERGDCTIDNKEYSIPEYYKNMAGNGIRRIYKSRYDSISAYICNHKSGKDYTTNLKNYNDLNIPMDEESYETLIKNGIDEPLAKHISHLFIRDPLVIYKERININNEMETDHFENIQSTNWQTVRWKPPPPSVSLLPSPKKFHLNNQTMSQNNSINCDDPDSNNNNIGWRTEFRSMEIQLTDFENAAFTVFLVLVSRVILTFNLNLYIPISKVDKNMKKAHYINSIKNKKFYFRSHLAPPEKSDCSFLTPNEENKNIKLDNGICCSLHSDINRYEKMTMDEIMNGKGSYYPGLIPLCYAYLDLIKCDNKTKKKLNNYLTLIKKKSTGELPTTATWIRDYIKNHPKYENNSIITDEIAYDLLIRCKQIGEGMIQCPELIGTDVIIKPIQNNEKNAYDTPLISNQIEYSKRMQLLKRYLNINN